MFKEIIESHKRTSLLVDAIDELVRMIERAGRMFGAACAPFIGADRSGADLGADDRALNEGERLVRRLVVQHLAINPEQDMPASLVLFSMAHDVERLGDYAKCLLELSAWADGGEKSAAANEQLHAAIQPLFELLVAAVRDEDADRARQIMRAHEEVKKRTDALLESCVREGGREAVVQALLTRYMRRISAHLSNAASGIVNPLDRLGGKED